MALTYLDSSAIVKLVVREPESAALRSFLGRRRLVSSALARTEVLRALLPLGDSVVAAGQRTLMRLDLIRINDRLLNAAAALLPADVRSLDAIHLATAEEIADELTTLVTYDQRMADAAKFLDCRIVAPR